MTLQENVLTAIHEQNIRFVDLWFIDIMGMHKSVTVPATQIAEILDFGLSFDGSSVDGFARVAESDMVLLPDPATFAVLPWSHTAARTARLICTVATPSREPFVGDPRTALINALQRAAEMGYVFKTGMELEFFVFRNGPDNRPDLNTPYDEASYYDLSTESAHNLRRAMMTTLDTMGIRVNSAHSEIGHGQHEIELDYDDALTCADQIVTARIALKTVTAQHDAHCTFMPRPCASSPGSGMHTHQSLHDIHTGENVFVDLEDEYGLSAVARYFLAGQLNHARAMTAILAPLVNSYKRLGTSFEAPVHVTWAHINRAALIRVPGMQPGQESHTRLELRCPDPSSNPYLATAVMLHAGLDGIRRRLPLPEPLEETLLMQKRSRIRHYEVLPSSLGEALDALEQCETVLSALGPYIADRYVAAKRQEFDEYNSQITAWELERYLSRY